MNYIVKLSKRTVLRPDPISPDAAGGSHSKNHSYRKQGCKREGMLTNNSFIKDDVPGTAQKHFKSDFNCDQSRIAISYLLHLSVSDAINTGS